MIEIGGRRVGAGHPVYIVAEMSANHGQRFDRAVEIIQRAREAGADAIKLQTYTPDTLTIRSDAPVFQLEAGPWRGRSLYDLYSEAQTPWEWHEPLKRVAEQIGLDFFSTPFDASAVDFLQSLDVAAYKIASFELVDPALLTRVGNTGRPVILSTGLATLGEIDEAVATLRAAGARDLALLKCTSAYPAPAEEMNLRTIPHLANAFRVPVGLSDHTLGLAAAVCAVALGASIVEKHLTLSRAEPGPDSAFSLEPAEFAAMVRAVREAEQALGEVRYAPTPHESESRVFRRSLFVVRPMRRGDVFSDEHVRSIRPGYGLPAKFLPEILGRQAAKDIEAGTPLSWSLIGA